MGRYDDIEIHDPFVFSRLDKRGTRRTEVVPGFFLAPSLGDSRETLDLIRSALYKHPSANKHNLDLLCSGSCPLSDGEKAVIMHPRETPILQVVRRMTGTQLKEFFPEISYSPHEFLCYNIVQNHWMAGAAYLFGKSREKEPSDEDIMKLWNDNDGRFRREYRAYWTIINDILRRQVVLINPHSDRVWPLKVQTMAVA
jgi:hypothetical protein